MILINLEKGGVDIGDVDRKAAFVDIDVDQIPDEGKLFFENKKLSSVLPIIVAIF